MSNIKEKISFLTELATKENNDKVKVKLAQLSGLYSAYEMINDEKLLGKVLEELLDIIETMLIADSNTFNILKAVNNKKNKVGELAEFYKYLVEVKNKKPTTSDVYRKAINQVIKAQNLTSLEELSERILEVYEVYRNNDSKDHNIHTAALKQYAEYIGVVIEKI